MKEITIDQTTGIIIGFNTIMKFIINNPDIKVSILYSLENPVDIEKIIKNIENENRNSIKI